MSVNELCVTPILIIVPTMRHRSHDALDTVHLIFSALITAKSKT